MKLFPAYLIGIAAILVFSACATAQPATALPPVQIHTPTTARPLETDPPTSSLLDIQPTATHLPLPRTPTLPPVTPAPPTARDSNRIYAYDGIVYGWLDPQAIPYTSLQLLKPDQGRGPTGAAAALAFSHHTGQVAYVTEEAGGMTLWVGDPALDRVHSVWQDGQDWLEFDPSGFGVLSLKWIGSDHFVQLSTRSGIVLVRTADGFASQLSGPCDRISRSPTTDQLSAWCPSSGGFLVIERNGEVWESTDLDPRTIFAVDWTFSPDGKKVLYADQASSLHISDGISSLVSLPAAYFPPHLDTPIRTLQWSQDGAQALVYGKSLGGNCSIQTGVCWSLFDAQTGAVAWSAAGDLALSDFDAALSPDGKVLVLSVMLAPDRFCYLVDIEKGSHTLLGDRVYSHVTWGSE